MNAEILIMAACGAGFGWSCWKAGLKQGAINCIDLLQQKKICPTIIGKQLVTCA